MTVSGVYVTAERSKNIVMKERELLLLTGLILMVTAWFSLGYSQSDEHFQILEFAGLKMGINQPADLAWEYHERMRPTLQPTLVFLLVRFWAFFSIENPFFIALFLRLLSAALFLVCTYRLYRTYCNDFFDLRVRRLFFLSCFLLWFEIYNGSHFTSEHWSGSIFILGFVYFKRREPSNTVNYFHLGLILGLSFLFRYQVGFLILGFVLWLAFIKKIKRQQLSFLAIGGLCLFCFGVLVDSWFYGQWTLSTWQYFSQNIVHQKAASFGVSPWYTYFWEIFLKGIPPVSLVYLVGPIVFFFTRPNHLLTWILVPFILVHFAIGHKELRFLYPIIGFLPILIFKSGLYLRGSFGKTIFYGKFTRSFLYLFWAVNSFMLLIVLFRALANEVLIYRFIYNHFPHNTILFAAEEDPYQMALEVNFYKPPGTLPIVHTLNIDSVTCPPGKQCLIALRKPIQFYSSRKDTQLIYSSYPDWAGRFNINGWLDRTHWWYIYQVKQGSD